MKTLHAYGQHPRRDYTDADALRLAYLDAHNNFLTDFSRSPQYDIVRFKGTFTTHYVIFEIIEDGE